MRVIVFGGTGMIGGGVLRKCLEDERVEAVLAVGRRPTGLDDPKLTELQVSDLFQLGPHREQFVGYDACFFCLGVSSAGMSEEDYHRITYDLTIDALGVVVDASEGITICFVSGQGTDSSEKGRVMWARVKGKAENALLAWDQRCYVFRPGIIQPLKGARSATALYRWTYTIAAPLFPIMRRLFPGAVTTTVAIGRAMIRAVEEGYSKSILETRDINELGR